MGTSALAQLLNDLWEDYVTTNPPVQHIYDLFAARGERIINDHIAFRTFNHPEINLDVFSKVFTDLGYQEKGDYRFVSKKLLARHLEHPDAAMPLIFISELTIEEFDSEIARIIHGLIDQIPSDFTNTNAFVRSGRPWNVSYKNYLALREVSEYAAWTAAFGFRVNHFTISINHLKRFDGILAVNQFLKDSGFKLNSAGGEVKGTPQELLEQSSTIAYNTEVQFSDGTFTIPACYYEFALRYQKPDGSLFRGFIPESADKIFESTNKGQDFKSKGM